MDNAAPEPGAAAGSSRPVFARHAASLLVVRDTPAGPEVLMGVRGAGHRFMPNRLVFPGGAVDPGDGRSLAAAEPRQEVLDQLGHASRPRLARAVVACAARELAEETGLSLGEPPELDGIDYLCRAVTPPQSPIRFNARFLVVSADRVHGTLSDSRELAGLAFRLAPAVVSEGLALVTREVLDRFLVWHQARLADRRKLPKLVFQRQRWRPDT